MKKRAPPSPLADSRGWAARERLSPRLGQADATGAAVAYPDRKVVSLRADGSARYTVQALWTQARERIEMLDFGRPDSDWVGLARSLGVPGARRR